MEFKIEMVIIFTSMFGNNTKKSEKIIIPIYSFKIKLKNWFS